MGSLTRMMLKSTLPFLFLCSVYSFRQCDNKFPDGFICDEFAEEITQADPENCWKFYRCHGGCVTHEMCELNYKYDDRYAWCTHPEYVVCGDRPCDDPQHCPCATTFPDGSTCDEDTEDETKADPDHCWKFFKCHGGCVTLETCHMDEVYDDRYNWCTYPEYVDCGDRPCDNSYYCP